MLCHFTFWPAFIYLMLTGHLLAVATTLYLHRSTTHRTVRFHPVVSHPLRFILWFYNGIVTQVWKAIHAYHHFTVETEQDPHSPKWYGINEVLWFGIVLYKRAAKNKEMIEKFGKGTVSDWVERHLYAASYSQIGVLLLSPLVSFMFFQWYWALMVWVGQMLWIGFWAGGVINGLGHFKFVGSRSFDTPDDSQNIFPWWASPFFAWFVCGEDWHHYHHHTPGSAKFTIRPREFDLGWVYIKILLWLRLATLRDASAAGN